MILLISPYQTAPDCAAQIESATHEQVKIVTSIKLALAALRGGDFKIVAADENLLECSPGSAESLVHRMGGAIPVFVDMACSRPERIVKFILAAIHRRELENDVARQQAIAELRS